MISALADVLPPLLTLFGIGGLCALAARVVERRALSAGKRARP